MVTLTCCFVLPREFLGGRSVLSFRSFSYVRYKHS
ncbi:hypothetical protein COLO4_33748 [Corchorus olitorius]|uniref:Uncharacterized protein n=1 Tax=Corchorus olitorius TaxID=93759 RepID=A0A1R3GRS5_9ROSI|nr:hypothetical protein COLO4_33748 [Corchorus olitorius]